MTGASLLILGFMSKAEVNDSFIDPFCLNVHLFHDTSCFLF
jgi:hypothetical protein